MDWSYFDAIYCISLEGRSDRRESLTPIFDKYNIPAEFFIAQKCPKGGIQGCFESHIEIMSICFEKGYQNVLILEDDIVDHPSGFSQDDLNIVTDFLSSYESWEIFYLGVVPDMSKPSEKISNKIHRVRGWCTHAYVASRKLMEKLYLASYSTAEIDAMFVRTHNAYSVYPGFFYQRSGEVSDLQGSDWPFKEIGVRMIEHYQYNLSIDPTVFIIGLLVLIFLLSFLCYWSKMGFFKSMMFIIFVIVIVIIYSIIISHYI